MSLIRVFNRPYSCKRAPFFGNPHIIGWFNMTYMDWKKNAAEEVDPEALYKFLIGEGV